ncbi:MAG: DUF1648 domain-containing protein [Acidobacteriota bacterium]
MTMALATRLMLVLTLAMNGLTLFVICHFRRDHRLFLIDLGRQLTAPDHARARRVQWVNAICVGASIAGVLTVRDPERVLALVMLGALVPMAWLIVEAVAVARSIEREPFSERYVVRLDRPLPISEYVSAPLQAINAASLAVGTAVVAWLIDRLPERVPVHWNAAGEPDRWGSPSEHWLMLPTLLFTTGILWMALVFIARERWALPPEDGERYDALQLRRRHLLAQLVQWTLVGANVGMVLLWVGTASNAMPGWSSAAGSAVVVGTVVMALATIGPLVYCIPRLLRVGEAIRRIAGTEVLGTHQDGWIWRGLIYYAPNDPAILVPKRIGLGQTLNFGRPIVWVILLMLAGFPALLLLLA